MGRVWLAEDELLGRRVALKQVVLPGHASEHVRAIALAEARAAARLDHHGVVKVQDVIEDADDHWIVHGTRCLGEPWPTRWRRMDRSRRRRYGGSRYTWSTHCGPSTGRVWCTPTSSRANVQLCDDGRVVLMDFGIATAIDDQQTLSSEALAGSPAYMSPERARGDAVGPASDLFSLGATLFAAVEGRSPFGAGDLFSTLVAVVEARPAPFVNAGPLRPIIEALLAKSPSDRLTVDQTTAALHPGARHAAARRATPVVASLRRFTMMLRQR